MTFVYRRALSILVVAVILAVGSPFAATEATAGSCWTWTAKEKRFARFTNRARVVRDRPRLKLDPELSKVARVHSREMLRKGRLFHTSRSVLGNRVTRWTHLGENVGRGVTLRRIHRAFMRSSAHRANILDRKFGYLGVGIRRGKGSLWVTVVFASGSDPGTRLKMPC